MRRSTRPTRRAALARVAVAALLTTSVAACGGDADGQGSEASSSASADPSGESSGDASGSGTDGEFPLEVTGELGSEPEVTFESPLDVEETVSEIVIQGEGDPVADGSPVLLDLYLANAATGEKIGASFDNDQPVATQLSSEAVFPAAFEALRGQPVGTRAAVVAQPEDGYGADGMPQLQLEPDQDLVVVVDLVSAAPTDYPRVPDGDRQKVPGSLPKVETDRGTVTGLDFSSADEEPPSGLQLYTLIEGDGKEYTEPALAAFNYFGQVWGADAPFDQSFDAEPLVQPLGLGQFIEGWDEGLVGVKAGSRVMLVVPPSKGYGEAGQPAAGIEGDDTMVFVIDILGVG